MLDERRGLLAHELWSQVELHRVFGGVVPELASRDHVRRLLPLVRTALEAAATRPEELQGVAYTAGPGLVGALLCGAALARSLAHGWQLPALGIHHLEGHLLAPLLESPAPQFPHLALLVSGGHTMLIEALGLGDYRLLGETRDDAAGEAFDKSAKLLGLPYPGGPQLAELAQTGRPGACPLPRPMLDRPGYEFSFSGLKTAVALAVRSDGARPTAPRRHRARRAGCDHRYPVRQDTACARCNGAPAAGGGGRRGRQSRAEGAAPARTGAHEGARCISRDRSSAPTTLR